MIPIDSDHNSDHIKHLKVKTLRSLNQIVEVGRLLPRQLRSLQISFADGTQVFSELVGKPLE